MDNLKRIQPPVFPFEKIAVPEAGSYLLDNGIPVFFIESGTEDILRIEFTFRAGQINETSPLLASTTNQMLSEGSVNYSSEELNRLLDFHGAFLNLTAEKDRAGLVMFCLNKHIDKVLELCKEIIFRPLFPEAELISLMNKRLRWFMVNREKVQNLAFDQFFESIFGNDHPYGRQLQEADFHTLNPTLLNEFHNNFYTAGNLAIIISGKIPLNAPGLLNNYFGDKSIINSNNADSRLKPAGQTNKKVHITKPGTVQTAIRIGSPTISKQHPDYPGLKVLDSILGGYFSSRLMKNIREEKGYTYGISSSLSSLEMAGYKVISTEVGQKNYLKAIDEIYKEILKLQAEPVSDDELKVVRNIMAGELLRMFDGPFAQAESFRSVWDFGLDNSYYYRLAEKIKTIDADEIMSLANTYYNISDLYQITAGL
jgi:predicted Zn-dependent peptidase